MMKQNLKKKKEAGFSLMELLIVMVIMLVILTAVFSLLRGTIITSHTNYEMTAATQGLRNAQEFISRDILTLGDGAKGLSNIWLPTQFVNGYLTVRHASEIDPRGSGYVAVGAVISEHLVQLQFRYILKPSASGVIFDQPCPNCNHFATSRPK